ncbi:MAG: hypothetical protein ACO3JG_15440 [Luteolibacter sp.]
MEYPAPPSSVNAPLRILINSLRDFSLAGRRGYRFGAVAGASAAAPERRKPTGDPSIPGIDRDFLIYRRRGNKIIPVLMPGQEQ